MIGYVRTELELNVFATVKYTPWYTLLSLVPFWFIWAAASSIQYGSKHPPVAWTAFWFWLWTLYPICRGFGHILRWEEERKDGVPQHRVVNHPHMLALTSLGMIVGSHYAFKKKD